MQKRIAERANDGLMVFANVNRALMCLYLTSDIKTGKYKACAQTWVQGDDIADAKRSALAWARDTNLYVCSSVFPDSVEAVSKVDLGGDYFEQAAETEQIQIAKGGYRLAHWLDQLAAVQQRTQGVVDIGLGFLK